MPEDDVSARDALAVAQRALSKANGLEDRVDELEATNDELQNELAQVRLRLSEHDDDRDYRDLSRNDKVGLVREHAFEKADGGTASLDYDDIMWEVFEGEPSADHCYTLMQLAADIRGFEVREPPNRNRVLHVDAREAKRGVVFSSANKTAAEGVR